MDVILLVFVGSLCVVAGVRVFNAEEQNHIFTKHKIEVTDVKKYNHLCAALIFGFGATAEVTIYFMITNEGLVATFCTIGVIAEAMIVMLLYNMIERKMIKKR